MNDESARQYVRTSDNIPVYYEVVTEKNPAQATTDWETLFDDIEPKPEENPKLYEVLFDINQKLNILLSHLAGKTGFNIPEAREVNISGGGVRFLCNDPFKEGDRLVLKTFLPTHAHSIRIKCEVVRSAERPEGGYEIAVEYLDLDEATRDKIIKYIFSRQREMLRSDKHPSKDGKNG